MIAAPSRNSTSALTVIKLSLKTLLIRQQPNIAIDKIANELYRVANTEDLGRVTAWRSLCFPLVRTKQVNIPECGAQRTHGRSTDVSYTSRKDASPSGCAAGPWPAAQPDRPRIHCQCSRHPTTGIGFDISATNRSRTHGSNHDGYQLHRLILHADQRRQLGLLLVHPGPLPDLHPRAGRTAIAVLLKVRRELSLGYNR